MFTQWYSGTDISIAALQAILIVSEESRFFITLIVGRITAEGALALDNSRPIHWNVYRLESTWVYILTGSPNYRKPDCVILPYRLPLICSMT